MRKISSKYNAGASLICGSSNQWAAAITGARHADGNDGDRVDACTGGVRRGAVVLRKHRRPPVRKSAAFFCGPLRHIACIASRVRQLEQLPEAVLLTKPHQRVRNIVHRVSAMQLKRSVCANTRQHHGASTCLVGEYKKRQLNQALGRLRSRRSLHLRTDLDRISIGFHQTGGSVSNPTQLETLLDHSQEVAAFACALMLANRPHGLA